MEQHGDRVSINLPSTPSSDQYSDQYIYIYISRDHDEVTIDELCEEIFLFLQETTWSIQGRRGEKRSKRNCELSGPRRESG